MTNICDKYSKSSLMGNWYEERWAPNQPFKQSDNMKELRPHEEGICYPANGNLLPLPRVRRNKEWDTTGVIPDDKFKEFRSLCHTTYDKKVLDNYYKLNDCRSIIKTNGEKLAYTESNPHSIQTNHSKVYQTLNNQNLKEITENLRNVKQYNSDFGSTFRKHELDHNRFYKMTTNHEFYGRPAKENPQDVILQYQKNEKLFSGVNERPVEQQCLKMTSVLTGEKYKNMNDPKDNTTIQRAWLPFKDKAIVVAERNIDINNTINSQKGFISANPLNTYKNNIKQTFNYDIATSLAVGDGEYSIKKKCINNGEFRHVRTDVTLIRNPPLMKR